jgi:uncharacterized protein (TIGR03086 family)
MTAYPVLVEGERRLTELVESLSPADLDSPTPCDGWDVRALLSHTLAGMEILAASIDGGPAPTAEDLFGGRDRVGDDPVGATKRATTRSQAAWADLNDPDRELTTILGSLPAGQVMAISAFATVAHGVDLAIATARPTIELPAELLEHARAVAEQIVPGLRGEDDGSLFRPETHVPAESTPTQHLMAYLGRTMI